MIKLENTVLPSPEQWMATIMGARNAMNSWEKSDSLYTCEHGGLPCSKCVDSVDCSRKPYFRMGPNDHALMMKLRNAGTDHRKYMRMIVVYVDITAPLYWWKEFDTYKVGTVANSCSTMHKIHEKEFTLDDFSHEHLRAPSRDMLNNLIDMLNHWRDQYHVGSNIQKDYWWQMIQLLPSSYNQKRTVMLNYEVLANIYKSRKNHKLDEWRDLCKWIEGLPYSEIITGGDEKDDRT